MGDMTKKKVERKSLEERAAEREARRQEVHTENETIAYISGEKKTEAETLAQYQRSKNPPREKAISARVNGDIFDRFKAICEQKNMTTNAGLNMLIAEYVRLNEG
jgi:predicted transcriptional regulator